MSNTTINQNTDTVEFTKHVLDIVKEYPLLLFLNVLDHTDDGTSTFSFSKYTSYILSQLFGNIMYNNRLLIRNEQERSLLKKLLFNKYSTKTKYPELAKTFHHKELLKIYLLGDQIFPDYMLEFASYLEYTFDDVCSISDKRFFNPIELLTSTPIFTLNNFQIHIKSNYTYLFDFISNSKISINTYNKTLKLHNFKWYSVSEYDNNEISELIKYTNRKMNSDISNLVIDSSDNPLYISMLLLGKLFQYLPTVLDVSVSVYPISVYKVLYHNILVTDKFKKLIKLLISSNIPYRVFNEFLILLLVFFNITYMVHYSDMDVTDNKNIDDNIEEIKYKFESYNDKIDIVFPKAIYIARCVYDDIKLSELILDMLSEREFETKLYYYKNNIKIHLDTIKSKLTFNIDNVRIKDYILFTIKSIHKDIDNLKIINKFMYDNDIYDKLIYEKIDEFIEDGYSCATLI